MIILLIERHSRHILRGAPVPVLKGMRIRGLIKRRTTMAWQRTWQRVRFTGSIERSRPIHLRLVRSSLVRWLLGISKLLATKIYVSKFVVCLLRRFVTLRVRRSLRCRLRFSSALGTKINVVVQFTLLGPSTRTPTAPSRTEMSPRNQHTPSRRPYLSRTQAPSAVAGGSTQAPLSRPPSPCAHFHGRLLVPYSTTIAVVMKLAMLMPRRTP